MLDNGTTSRKSILLLLPSLESFWMDQNLGHFTGNLIHWFLDLIYKRVLSWKCNIIRLQYGLKFYHIVLDLEKYTTWQSIFYYEILLRNKFVMFHIDKIKIIVNPHGDFSDVVSEWKFNKN